ncbi:hypothetical protein QNF13_004303 [Vibrio vulnificus]|uniref:hypothetical protein n=2 Tax=Vibrio vulnificus TaxID=672 RepID=UPI0015934B48|nr:hypothetical protein [Vibrio vulnificus]ELV8578933.1 hypothetical protein [Vibrio vulnificus]ELV8742107.1 hypothetical protein [Vibrio vulnificus]
MDPRMRGNDSWWRGGGVLSFLFFAAELSSDFSFLIFVILANAGNHPSAPAFTVVVHNNPSNLRSLSPKTKKPTFFQVLA